MSRTKLNDAVAFVSVFSNVGLRVNVPIYHGRLNAAVSEAMHQFMKARAEYDQLVLDVQSEVQSAYEQVRESQRTVALYSEKLIPAAEQNVTVARANYDVSKINFLDLAVAQRQLIDARDRQIQAQVDLQRRLASLRRAIGGSLPETQSGVREFPANHSSNVAALRFPRSVSERCFPANHSTFAGIEMTERSVSERCFPASR
ncbi:MAG: TolC family protein [Planctomycetaceae bacterium]